MFTPGPWIAQKANNDRKSLDAWRILSLHPSVGCAGCHVCDIDGESDAKLIASSPDLLSMLKRLVAASLPTMDGNRYHISQQLLSEACDVIGSAEGRARPARPTAG